MTPFFASRLFIETLYGVILFTQSLKMIVVFSLFSFFFHNLEIKSENCTCHILQFSCVLGVVVLEEGYMVRSIQRTPLYHDHSTWYTGNNDCSYLRMVMLKWARYTHSINCRYTYYIRFTIPWALREKNSWSLNDFICFHCHLPLFVLGLKTRIHTHSGANHFTR